MGLGFWTGLGLDNIFVVSFAPETTDDSSLDVDNDENNDNFHCSDVFVAFPKYFNMYISKCFIFNPIVQHL